MPKRTYSGDALERRKLSNNRWKADNRLRTEYSFVCSRALSKGRPFDLTFEDFERLYAPMTCAATGHRLSWEWPHKGKRNPWKPSLDQILPGAGYTKENVRVVSYIYNLAKLEWDDEIVESFRGTGI